MKLAIIFFVVFVFSIVSCEKMVLDKDPLSEITPEVVWADFDYSNYFVNGIYSRLMGHVRGLDCGTEIGDEGPSWAPIDAWNIGDVSALLNPLEDWYGEWSGYYVSIRRTNLILENSATIKGDPIKIEQLKGQAYFLRAWFYSSLVNLYGPVPIINRALELGEDLSISRSTYEECIQFITEDLDSATALLPLNWEGVNLGRATKGSAMGLKSRMLLYAASPLNNLSNDAAKWQAASDAAKAVIDLNQYSLYPDYYEIFHEDNNQEVIFDVQYAFPTRTMNIEFDQNPANIDGAQGLWKPTQELVDSYEMADGKKIFDPGSGYDEQNPYINRDPRFYASVLYNGAPWREQFVETFMNGLSGPGDQNESGNSMTGYYCRKFINEKNPIGEDDNKTNTNWILIRYAEILLNYAEAELQLNNENVAKQYINMVRNRGVGMMPPIPDAETGNELIDHYRNERKIELAFEEHHFFDVRRWKVAPSLLSLPVHNMHIVKEDDGTFTYAVEELEERVWRDALYYYPIPLDDINKNVNLKQNPGY